jgi:hypothetical protein
VRKRGPKKSKAERRARRARREKAKPQRSEGELALRAAQHPEPYEGIDRSVSPERLADRPAPPMELVQRMARHALREEFAHRAQLEAEMAEMKRERASEA